MKQGHLYLGGGVLLLCLTVWGIRGSGDSPARDGQVPDPARMIADPSSRKGPAKRADGSRKSGTPESWAQFETFLADLRDNPTAGGAKFPADTETWSRSQLKDALERLMEDGLDDQLRGDAFGELLFTFSEKDSESALELYARAREVSDFNNDERFSVHRLVLNFADQDPAKAAQWVEAHKNLFSSALYRAMLEKIDQKNRK
jgi:hypothetical protein